jgi:heterodisulfide reductase subunit A2
MSTPPRVLVIGAGIAGLTAANVLADHGVEVDLVERRPAAGGHAARLACKATRSCVACGACIVCAAVETASHHPRIRLHLSSRAENVRAQPRGFAYRRASKTASAAGTADAVLITTGFDVFDPRDKPYGYRVYPDVIRNLELETMLRSSAGVVKPSDGTPPARVAFLQCVGSRDRKLGHPWCSEFCCGASVRAAMRVKAARPATEITVFYIDIQSFGRDFQSAWDDYRRNLRFIRGVPAEAFQENPAGIRLAWLDLESHRACEERFDLVVLAAGMVPPAELPETIAGLGLQPTATGFLPATGLPGVFAAGAVRGPKTIPASVADACHAAARVLAHVRRDGVLAADDRPGSTPAPRQTIFRHP